MRGACFIANVAFLAFFIRSSSILLTLPFPDHIKPRYLLLLTYSSVSPFMCISFSCEHPIDRTITFVLLTLISSCYLSQYSCSLCRQFWRPDLLVDMVTKSSAQETVLNIMSPSLTGSQSSVKISCLSFWYMFEKVGLRLHPCLTPDEDTKLSVLTMPGFTLY